MKAKKWITVFLSMMIFLMGIGTATLEVDAAGYGSAWQKWSTDSSSYSVMRTAGCRVIAYAKMLSEIGMNRFGTPDDLYKWGVDNSKFINGISEKGKFGTMMMDYVKANGGTVSKKNYKITSNKDADCKKIMELIGQGYSCFLACGGHTVYIGRAASLERGTPVIMDGDGKQKLYKDYNTFVFTDLNYFFVQGTQSSSAGSKQSSSGATSQGAGNPVTFKSISHSKITETTACVRAELSADCNQLSAAGMEWGYVVNGTETKQMEFYWKTGKVLSYISVDFGREADRNGNIPSLTPGKTVYYRFFVVKKDGTRLYSATQSFNTPCSHDYSGETVKQSANCISSGIVEYRCAKCGDSYEICVPATGHNYQESVVAPTSKEGGYTIHTCANCGDCYTDNYTECLGTDSFSSDSFSSKVVSYDNITVSNITSNTAFIKANVTADCSQLRAAGMEWGYQVDGVAYPQTEFYWKTAKILNFISVDFGREIDRNGEIPTLNSGSIVYYYFFAEKKDGSRIYSDVRFFTTS